MSKALIQLISPCHAAEYTFFSNLAGVIYLRNLLGFCAETEWKNTITRVSKLSREKAVKKVQELSDFETAKREISRIVSGYESEYIYLGRDMSRIEKIKERYEAVYYALSNPILSLDSIALMYLTSR